MDNKTKLPQSLSDLKRLQEEVELQKLILIEKGLKSDDPSDIIQAARAANDIQKREESGLKSFLVDPYDTSVDYGFQSKNSFITYTTLRRMSKTPIISAIIGTRVEQIAAFCQPQQDKYSPGFVIRKKVPFGSKPTTPSRQDYVRFNKIIDFVLNCGSIENSWHGDDFETFIRKITTDSLALDQMCFEVVRDRRGIPVEFISVDGATIRIADSYDEDMESNMRNNLKIQGYLPSYVQVIMSDIVAEFYPWELCFGTRNTSTDINNSIYGRSELEDLITIVTAILNSDQYNMNFFKQGAAPKGILKVASGVNQNQIAAFRQHWMQMVAGASNSHKTPIIESDKVEFIDLQKSSRDMEFAKFQEYLLKVCCAIYKMDPSEVGFNLSGGSDVKVNYESSNEHKLQHSKDKGLRPLLRFIENKLNKYIINALDPELEIKFVGLDVESATEELEADIKKMAFSSFNEVREKWGMSKVEGGDIIANPVFLQSKQMEAQQQQLEAQQQMAQQQPNVEENPYEE